MSSALATPSRKLSWSKKMDAKVKNALKTEETGTEISTKSKSNASEKVEIVHKD